MSEGDENTPFERKDHIDQPGIIGASWWRESLANAADPVSRRHAINLALGATGTVLGLGALIMLANSCDEEDAHTVERRNSLEMQKTYGWSFGAATEPVTFDGSVTTPFERGSLINLVNTMRPGTARAKAYFVPNLFESLDYHWFSNAEGDPENIVPLIQLIVPIFTYEMRQAYDQGRALAGLLQDANPSDLLVMVDLDGPASVAFAAGALAVLEPIFTFGNWPHPRGVVKAHLTLAAAAYYQPLFAKGGADSRSPLLVLDRQRLASYSDDAFRFDNRYKVQLPSADVLKRWGIRHVLYVTPSPSLDVPWDVEAEVVGYAGQEIGVKLLSADIFAPDYGTDGGKSADFFYGGSKRTHGWFWHDYPWFSAKAVDADAVTVARPGKDYVAPSREQPSTLTALATVATLGTMAVAVSRENGHILGAMISRSGSWNRSDGSSGG